MAPPSYRTTNPLPSTLEEEEEEEEGEDAPRTFKEEEKKDYDTTFGFYGKADKIFWGDKEAAFTKKKKVLIGDKTFKRTPGLWELITSKNPGEDLITKDDKDSYAYILGFTNTMHQGNNPNNPYPKASKSLKWKNFVKPIWDRFKGKIGSGVKKVVIPADPNALLEKLDLLMASKAAGNTGVRNELVSVYDELKRQGVFDSDINKKIMSLL